MEIWKVKCWGKICARETKKKGSSINFSRFFFSYCFCFFVFLAVLLMTWSKSERMPNWWLSKRFHKFYISPKIANCHLFHLWKQQSQKPENISRYCWKFLTDWLSEVRVRSMRVKGYSASERASQRTTEQMSHSTNATCVTFILCDINSYYRWIIFLRLALRNIRNTAII